MAWVLFILGAFTLSACSGVQGNFELSDAYNGLKSEITHEELLEKEEGVTNPLPSEGIKNPVVSLPEPGDTEDGRSGTETPTDREPNPEENDHFLLSEFLQNQGVCSKLDFEGVLWPRDLMVGQELVAYSLALNLSGSFEGHEGFQNISNNFDGQGISLGLLNQNLGQGSLQPLMIKAFLKHENLFNETFSSDHASSLEAMLRKWAEGKSFATTQAIAKTTAFVEVYSPLDMNPELVQTMQLRADNQRSVNWAVDNLYNGSSFKPSWKREMQDLAGSPEYVVEQMQAALKLHERARGYQRELGFSSFRSYLLFFDIAVQNGSLKSADITDYKSWLQQGNQSLPEVTKLKKIVELRLRHVLSRWRNDVKLRKNSIIDGQGTVHGARRNYPGEYCFDLNNSL